MVRDFFACLLCDVVANDNRIKPSQMKRVVMVDNDDNINWEHVKLLNEFHQGQNKLYAPIDTYRACVYSNEFSACLCGILNPPKGGCSFPNIFVIGTHLCRRLSAHAVEVYNELVHATPNESKCALLLAPCCLPVFSRILLYKKAAATPRIRRRPRSLSFARVDFFKRWGRRPCTPKFVGIWCRLKRQEEMA